MDNEWEAPIWRLRFEEYTLFELSAFLVGSMPTTASRVAGEVMEAKLRALGVEPRG